ncbi:MAG: efflux transporter outer membrane subunit [Herbaspirillum sp.]
MMRTPIVMGCLLALSACASLAPDYQRPEAPIPAAWPAGAAYAQQDATQSTAADVPWRDFIVDERLRQVVAQALAHNRDLRAALANVEAARAQYRVQHAGELPTVEASVASSRARARVSGAARDSTTTVIGESASASIGLSSFEIDLFGKARSLSEAALQSALASEASARSTRITVIGETASAWLTLASDAEQLRVARQTMDSAERSMAVTRQRQALGVSSAVDVHQAETVYQQARVDVASLTTSLAQARNALQLLTGGPVADALLPDGLPADAAWLAEVPAGVSSSVLLQRPDVLQAEHQLQSANANIGAARAALFPSLELTASGGLGSAALSTLFSGGATVWSIAPSLSLPIFDGGARRATVAYDEAQRDAYVAQYEQAVQTAFKETADALARRGTIREQVDAQAALVAAAERSYQLADARYRLGADTYLNALDAQRTLYSARMTLASTRLTLLDNRVTLYRVLGGGAL